jgi:sensor domain CHASE-containing protein
LIRSDNPEVMEALSAQLRQAIDEYVRSATQARVLSVPSGETEIERTPCLKSAA